MPRSSGSSLRNQLGLSLRVEDVKRTLSHLDAVKRQRWISEMNRQLDSDPKVLALSLDVNRELREWLQTHRFGDPAVDVSQIGSQEELVRRVSETIRLAIPAAMAEVDAKNGNTNVRDLSHANVAAPPGTVDPLPETHVERLAPGVLRLNRIPLRDTPLFLLDGKVFP